MTKVAALALAFACVAGTALFTGGEEEATGAATAASTAAVVVPGELVVWASPAEFTSATGATLPAYTEAPVLAEMVAAGELPPVLERLPDEPVVIDPKNEIGTYGGDYRSPALSPTSNHDAMFARLQNLLTLTPDRTTTIANVVRSWEVSDDNKMRIPVNLSSESGGTLPLPTRQASSRCWLEVVSLVLPSMMIDWVGNEESCQRLVSAMPAERAGVIPAGGSARGVG